MKMEESIYPYFPEAERLPFYLTGIGGSEYQGEVDRPQGYHWHQILFCAAGEGVLEAGGTERRLLPGDRVFLPKGLAHRYHPTGDLWDVRWVAFDGWGCENALARLGMTGPVVVSSETSDMEDIFDRMVELQRTDILYCGYSCSGLVYDYVLAFHRSMEKDLTSRRSRKLSMLLPTLQYMHGHFSQDLPLTRLAGMLDITPQHYCRLFREALNMRPGDYLLHLRLNEARKLLRETNLPVAVIAERCGFSDPSYFSTVFKRHEGVSPARYRRAP